MNRLHLIIIQLLCFFNFAFAQNQSQEIPDKKSLLQFKVTDFDGIPEADAEIRVFDKDTVDKKIKTDVDGKATLLVDQNKSFFLEVRKFDTVFVFSNPVNVPVQAMGYPFDLGLKIKLVSEYQDTYKIAVHFEVNKFELQKSDLNDLNKLVEKMKQNPKLRIELAAHCDNVGDDAYNLRLSQQRANAVRDYLVSKGVQSDRLLAKGYGESQPIMSNDTEAGRANNRRTEVRVIEQ